jgi:hypothetical protein
MQLPPNVCRGGELRSPGHGVEPVYRVSMLRQAARSQEPVVADGISFGRVLEGGRVLARGFQPAYPRSKNLVVGYFDKRIYTNLLYFWPQLTVRQLRHRFSGTALPTCRVRRTELALRQLNAEADA